MCDSTALPGTRKPLLQPFAWTPESPRAVELSPSFGNYYIYSDTFSNFHKPNDNFQEPIQLVERYENVDSCIVGIRASDFYLLTHFMIVLFYLTR